MAVSKAELAELLRPNEATYLENKKRNDRLAEEYKATKKTETSARKTKVERAVKIIVIPGVMNEKVGTTKYMGGPTVLKVSVPPPTVYVEKPDDVVDYTLAPASAVVSYETVPHHGTIVGIIPALGSLLVYAGKQLLVSMAIAGLESALSAPVFQRAQRNSNVAIRYKTAQPGKQGSLRVGPRPAKGEGPVSGTQKTLGNSSSFEGWAEGNWLGIGRGD